MDDTVNDGNSKAEAQTPSENLSNRRRILKGLVSAGGVPVMLTLSSGAALAANSNACLANQTQTYDINDTRCIIASDTEIPIMRRARRDAFSGAATTAANGLNGGNDGNVDDMCLVYHNPTTGIPADFATPGTPSTAWGKNGTNVIITASCWNSFIQ